MGHHTLAGAKCEICSKTLTTHERFAGRVCGDWRCRWKQLDNQLEEHRRLSALAVQEDAPAEFPIVVVPFCDRSLVTVSEETRQDIIEHLLKLRESLATPSVQHSTEPLDKSNIIPAEQEDPPELKSALGKVCGVCEGYCCHYGAVRHAFLQEETLARFIGQSDGVSAEECVELYIAKIPEQHCEGSCIYHTASGCNLPGNMRADICNTYECRGLKDRRQQMAKSDNARAFVVIRHENRIMGSAFVDESRLRRTPSTRKS